MLDALKKRIKYRLYCAAAVFLCFCLLPGCLAVKAVSYEYPPEQIVEWIAGEQSFEEGYQVISFGDDLFSEYLSMNYGIDTADIRSGGVLFYDGANAAEIVILRVKETGSADAAAELFPAYIETRKDVFFGYMPEAVFLLENAVVRTEGDYAALFVSEDPEDAENLFLDVVLGNREIVLTADLPEETEETAAPTAAASPEYDPAGILAAYRSGNGTRLHPFNRSILNAAEAVILEQTDETMTDYEKELAIHDWMLTWGDYDTESQSQSPDAEPNPENENPYGFLIDREAICKGYTSTFRLFMDMLGIECITVEGKSADNESDHAWNMVRLSGEWYAVDVTWDDPVGNDSDRGWPRHEYFNCTSEHLRDTGHHWEEEGIPEATADRYAWGGR